MRSHILAALLMTASASALSAAQPDIVYIVIDDASGSVMRDGLPRTIDYIAREGTTFENFYTTSPLCGPSRASTLRGQYAHNTGVLSNVAPSAGPGHTVFRTLENRTVATVLNGAGYHTSLIGKYMNGFPSLGTYYKPPGWDRIYLKARGGTDDEGNQDPHNNYVMWDGAKFIEVGNARAPRDRRRPPKAAADGNDRPRSDGLPRYETDRISKVAENTIRANPAAPLFLYVSPATVHYPFIPAERHMNIDAPFVRAPSYNEADLGDKSAWTKGRMLPMTNEIHQKMNQQQRGQRQMARSVDDMIIRQLAALRDTGRLDNAYVVITADNGYMAGEHRIAGGKAYPYDESQRMPLYIVGPGIAKGAVRKDLIANIDLLPTFAEMAGAQVPEFVDGRSFLSAARGGPPLTRNHIGIEMLTGSTDFYGIGYYRGFATQNGMYVSLTRTNEHEAYDMTADPYQMDNIWPALQPAVRDAVLATNAAISSCAAQTCRDAEDAPTTAIQR